MNLKNYIRSIPDYPKKGILFRDITTLIKNENAFVETINQIIERSKKFNPGVSSFKAATNNLFMKYEFKKLYKINTRLSKKRNSF